MAKIRVMRGGCGITYKDGNGVTRYILKTAENGPFECDDMQAERLVRLGVAIYVQEPDQEAELETTDDDQETEQQEENNQEPGKVNTTLSAADLENWDYHELKKLADDMNAEPKGKKKSDYIAAIAAVKVEPFDEDDDFPDLNPEEPV